MKLKTTTRNSSLERDIEKAISDKWQNISDSIPSENPLAYSRLELTLSGNRKKMATVFFSKGLGYILLIEGYPYFCVAYWMYGQVLSNWELEGDKFFEFNDM